MHSKEKPRLALVRAVLWLVIDTLDELIERDGVTVYEAGELYHVRGVILDQLHLVRTLEKGCSAPSPAA